MSFLKKTWSARIGTGLNRFLQNGTDYVTLQSAPESVTQQGDALSADNMNNLEQRIADAFDALDDEILTDEPSTTDTTHALTNAIATQIHNQTNARLENLEQKAGDYVEVQYRGTDAVPTGKAKYGIVNTIVGKTRAWNQLVQNGDFSDGSNNWSREGATSISVSSGIASFTVTTAAGMIRQSCSFINGHKYLAIARVKTTTATNAVLLNVSSSGGGGIAQSAESTNWQTIYLIFTQSGNADSFIRIQDSRTSGWDEIQVDYVLCRDITPIFGAGNEPSTVADALAQLPALGEYNAYDAGSLVDTEVSGVKSVGVNIWDEEWEVGAINDNTGENEPITTKIRSKNYIPVRPSIDYYFKNALVVFGYDSDKNAVSLGNTFYKVLSNQNYTIPNNVFYVRFYPASGSYGTTYKHDIQICLNSYSDKTTYHPYKTDTLSLPETVTLRSAGLVSEELYVETGEFTHPLTTVDLGEQTWSKDTHTNVFKTQLEKLPYNKTVVNCTVSNGWTNRDVSAANMPDKIFSFRANGLLYFRDDSLATAYTDDDMQAVKDAMADVVMNYELATPDPSTFIDPVPYNFLEVQGGGTVETIQEQTPVIDNCLDVGYLAL